MKLLDQLRSLFQGGYRFTDGSRLIPAGRDSQFYVDQAGRRVEVYTELLGGDVERRIEAASIDKWLPPYEQEITEGERQEIIGKICDYYRKTNRTFIVD